jgi:hypothetical protein
MNQYYEITIRGHLTFQWTAIFEGLAITCLPDGCTRIAGYLPDQSALYGLLMHLRDLGLTLISVEVIRDAFQDSPQP